MTELDLLTACTVAFDELEAATGAGYRPIRMGPRVLRTETAAVAAITALQCLAGDLSGRGGGGE